MALLCGIPTSHSTCTPTDSNSWADGIDNDCDGKIDEEICTHTPADGCKYPFRSSQSYSDPLCRIEMCMGHG